MPKQSSEPGESATVAAKKQRDLEPCPEEMAYLDLLRTSDLLARNLAVILKSADLSSTQYNVLRSLRGSRGGLPCGEIAGRMITRDPDITRLLDRLEKRGLISRSRAEYDRRTVITEITAAGLALLGRLDKPVREFHRRQFGDFGPERFREFAALLHRARGPED